MSKFLCRTYQNFDWAINKQQTLFAATISLENSAQSAAITSCSKGGLYFCFYKELFVTYKTLTCVNPAEAFSFSENSDCSNFRLHGTNAWLGEISMLSRIRQHWQIYFPLKLTIQCWCRALHNESKKQHPSVSALSECICAAHLQYIVAFP